MNLDEGTTLLLAHLIKKCTRNHRTANECWDCIIYLHGLDSVCAEARRRHEEHPESGKSKICMRCGVNAVGRWCSYCSACAEIAHAESQAAYKAKNIERYRAWNRERNRRVRAMGKVTA
jgi:hypothetical protein